MTKLEIIEDTVKYYSEDPSKRAIYFNLEDKPKTASSCAYLTTDGRKCAVGRYMLHPEKYEDGDIYALVSKGFTQDDLVEEVRGHDWGFWRELQSFHDGDSNWQQDGLSVLGKDNLNHLISKYGKVD